MFGRECAFLRTLNEQHRPDNVRYHLAIGRRSFFPPDRLGAIAEELDGILARCADSAAQRRAVAVMFASDELQDGKGDGVVSASSASFPAQRRFLTSS